MLNELLSLAQSLESAGYELNVRHKAIKEAKSGTALRVMLGPDGEVADVMPVPEGASLWTLRDGQKNSFPFVQPKYPLLNFPGDTPKSMEALGQKGGKTYRNLMAAYWDAKFSRDRHLRWMPNGYLESIRKRLSGMEKVCKPDGAVACATMERFLKACFTPEASVDLLEQLRDKLLSSLDRSPSQDAIDAAVAVLIGKDKKGVFLNEGALLFDASGFAYPIYHAKVVSAVSIALCACQDDEQKDEAVARKCQVSGFPSTDFITDTFPQPNLPTIGQTYLFSKNRDSPSLTRYNAESVESFLVGTETASRMDAALRAITDPSQKNKTWRSVAGEKPKQTDLLVAFVSNEPNQDLVSVLAPASDTDEEVDNDDSQVSRSITNYKEATRRFLDNVTGRTGGHYNEDIIQIMVIRKLDPANRKLVYSNSLSVSKFCEAAREWSEGEENTPPWLRLSLPKKGGYASKRPPHISPFGLVAFTRSTYIRGGAEKADVQGLPASETMRMFLSARGSTQADSQIRRILRVVVTRRGLLLSNIAEDLRRGNDARDYDRLDALRTVTVLGIILHKLERINYMNDPAFRLGQLLAAADMVHVGYCIDVRGGSIPPSLLGNQIFAMAQTSPIKALAALCRRWKPYEGWTRKTVFSPPEREKLNRLIKSKDKSEVTRGWSVLKALRHSKEVSKIALELRDTLPGCEINDVFRAELLLGYMAGLPKAETQTDPETTPENLSIDGDNNE